MMIVYMLKLIMFKYYMIKIYITFIAYCIGERNRLDTPRVDKAIEARAMSKREVQRDADEARTAG